MAFVADKENRVSFTGKAHGFEMNFGDQGAGGVDGAQPALGGSLADGRGDAVSAIKDVGPVRDLVDRVNEDDAARAKALDDMAIMHDLVVNIERRAEKFESALQALDRHIHAGTKAARI